MEIQINLDDFDYSQPLQKREIIDWDCLDYSFDYRASVLKRFPPGYESIPGFDEIIDKIVDNAKEISPSEEMERRIKEAVEQEQYLGVGGYEEEKEPIPELFSNHNYNGVDTNFSKFTDSQ
jgi:hypothetical protein